MRSSPPAPACRWRWPSSRVAQQAGPSAAGRGGRRAARGRQHPRYDPRRGHGHRPAGGVLLVSRHAVADGGPAVPPAGPAPRAQTSPHRPRRAWLRCPRTSASLPSPNWSAPTWSTSRCPVATRCMTCCGPTRLSWSNSTPRPNSMTHGGGRSTTTCRPPTPPRSRWARSWSPSPCQSRGPGWFPNRCSTRTRR